MPAISFEEVMFTVMTATQETFKCYMNIDLFAGAVDRKVAPVDSDVTGIIGVAGDRVGYIIVAADRSTAQLVAREMLMDDEPDEDSIRDAIGELINNIAGSFKTKYHDQYGNVAMGLPLVVSGQLRTVTEPPEEGASMNVQCKGVTIPFTNKDGAVNLKVMVYM
ncbi:chemotaxis protein CheX [Trichlorobacter ammonificans]|uniref:Chemotaxis protein CheX, a CheY P-specific phosphatase n=1 Tax=Trichlorobacter ammonificans TaxID=2916410 RepID=A0ABN8HF24_9BACT|nr:chemotaxis protein CheX [Trichlorobacter ammonificans]CAH2031470.1 Chemotaxis protein CheX, a CheY P-specific phosphatase [Trichlorobacter ammonificans]